MYIPQPPFRPAPRSSYASATEGAASLSKPLTHDDLRAPSNHHEASTTTPSLLVRVAQHLFNATDNKTNARLQLDPIQKRSGVQDTNVTIGVVVGILIAVFIAAVLAFMWIYRGSIRIKGRRRRRHRRKRKSAESSKSSKTSDGGGAPPPPPPDA